MPDTPYPDKPNEDLQRTASEPPADSDQPEFEKMQRDKVDPPPHQYEEDRERKQHADDVLKHDQPSDDED